MQADIGLIGLAVMGQNLVLNMHDHGFCVAVYNRTVSKVEEFLSSGAKGKNIIGANSVEELVKSLKRPRKVMLMVKAGEPVDEFIQKLLPFLEKGDIIIDGGNSHFADSTRRVRELEQKGILFVGAGVSGGEEGARHGPSIMPGGNPEAWPHLKDIFTSISAKTPSGESCCSWVGQEGAGHFVKMVHNGIEYGDMQLISEAYLLLKHVLKLSADQLSSVFSEWNKGQLNSYLIEITADILAYKDEDGSPLVEKILDAAGQKGTGKWTATTAFDLGTPLTLIAEAVYARCLSSLKQERTQAAKLFSKPKVVAPEDEKGFIEDVMQALLASKIVSYAQGYMLIQQAQKEYGWDLNFGAIAMLWREGCIIRSSFLGKIKDAFDQNKTLENLMIDPFFAQAIKQAESSWRRVVSVACQNAIPTPSFSSALSFFDGYTTEYVGANLIQAQRDYFGAHTYQRVDGPAGKHFHTNWTGTGGAVSSTAYNA